MINKMKGAFLLLSALPCLVSAENSAVCVQTEKGSHARFYIGADIGSSWRLPDSFVQDVAGEESTIDLVDDFTNIDMGFSAAGTLGYDRIYGHFLVGAFARLGISNSSCSGEVSAYQEVAGKEDAAKDDADAPASAEIEFVDHSRMFTQIGMRIGMQMREVLLFASVAYYGAFVKSALWDKRIDNDALAVIDSDITWRNGVSVAIGLDYSISPDVLIGVSLSTNFVAPITTLSTEGYDFKNDFAADFALESRPTDMAVMFGVKRLFGKSK